MKSLTITVLKREVDIPIEELRCRRPLGVEVGRVVAGEANSAMHLDVLVAGTQTCFSAIRAGDRSQFGEVV